MYVSSNVTKERTSEEENNESHYHYAVSRTSVTGYQMFTVIKCKSANVTLRVENGKVHILTGSPLQMRNPNERP